MVSVKSFAVKIPHATGMSSANVSFKVVESSQDAADCITAYKL